MFSAIDLAKETEPISLSIHAIADVTFTRGFQYMIVAYKQGQVNIYETPNADRKNAGYNFLG